MQLRLGCFLRCFVGLVAIFVAKWINKMVDINPTVKIKNFDEVDLANIISVIFPSIYFGGHEVMMIEIIKKLIQTGENEVVCFCASSNENLISALKKQKINVNTFTVISEVNLVSVYFSWRYLFEVWKVLVNAKKLSGAILLVQGSIELGCGFLLVSKLTGIKVSSYIPFAHSYKELNRKYAFIRDLAASVMYRMTNNYITISDFAKNQIIDKNKRAKVGICENYISEIPADYECLLNEKRFDVFNIFVVGRVVFSHKCQDILMAGISGLDEKLTKKITLHVVGNGPDLDSLKMMACRYNHVNVIFHGWVEEWWKLKPNPDLLVIPSRFEGVPLVMLEAMVRKIPIIASATDGMNDYLNEYALFENLTDFKTKAEYIRIMVEKCINDEKFLNLCSIYKKKSPVLPDLSAFLNLIDYNAKNK